MQTPGTEKHGNRVYVTGDTYALRDRLKAAGCHWDGDRRQWWIGAARADALAPVLAPAAGAPAGPPTPEPPGSVRLTGRGEYKGRTYYVGATTRDGTRCRLLTLPADDGTYLDFWAPVDQVRMVKTYPPRETGRGGARRTEYTTLGSVAAFVRRQRDPATRRGRCTECGASGPAGSVCRECSEGTFV